MGLFLVIADVWSLADVFVNILYYYICLFCEISNYLFFFFQAEDGIRDYKVTGVQTCALPISLS